MFCSLFRDCQKVSGSPMGAIGCFSPFACKGIRRRQTCCREGAGRGGRTCCPVWVPAGRSVQPCPALLLFEQAACSCAGAAPYVRHRGLKGVRGRKGVQGRQGRVFPAVRVKAAAQAAQGWPRRRCSVARGTWAVSCSPPSSSPAVPWCICPSGLFSCCLSRPSHELE